MDYLALLSTRSVVLFAPSPAASGSSPSSPASSPGSSASSPATPRASLPPAPASSALPPSHADGNVAQPAPAAAPSPPRLAPAPIAVALHAILYADAHTAYNLTAHCLSAGSGSGAGGVRCGAAAPAAVRAAEVAVWAELARAAAFGRELGAAYAVRDLGEGEVRALAEAHGVVLAPTAWGGRGPDGEVGGGAGVEAA